ncbi:MAG TPA: ribosome biogenesis GTP-binding protein YihA/YsxC [Gemmatimonadaceae bacterium]
MAATRSDPLVVKQLDFLGGMASVTGWRPDTGLPEVAFAGRSNVGKSSLINVLVRRRAAARISRTPGRTREINFFQVNADFVLADLPGYGYARVARAQREEWRPLIESYLRGNQALRGLVLLLDVRREPGAEDREMLDFLAAEDIPTLVAITKIDKYGVAVGAERVAAIVAALELDPDQVLPVSARTGAGRDELAQAVVDLLR